MADALVEEVAAGRARRPEPAELELLLEQHRKELTAYCYRMLGSAFEADDAVQETLMRAWRGLDRFEGRASFRSWMYRIATNVCLDMLRGRRRRARPLDLGTAMDPHAPLGAMESSDGWVEPIPDGWVLAADDDPAEVAVTRESIRLAFVAALQHLPARQRAVLILRDVLNWKAAEVADLLGGTVASVNSALQRARTTLADRAGGQAEQVATVNADQGELLARYVEAFERYDMETLTALIHEDATQSMPPYAMWLRGPSDILAFWVGPGAGCRGSRLIPARANGMIAFGQYRPGGLDGGFEPWAVQIIEVAGSQIVDFNFFLDTARFFPLFGLPSRLDR